MTLTVTGTAYAFFGGVMRKMIKAPSIVVSATATGAARQEGTILRRVFPHSLALAALMGLLVWLQSGPLAWMVPESASAGSVDDLVAVGRPSAEEDAQRSQVSVQPGVLDR
jgi:hypothetical protein